MKKFYFILSTLLLISTVIQAQGNSNSSKKLAKINYTPNEYNFGTVQAGEYVTQVIRFRNDGAVPLVITNVKGNCGVGVRKFSKAPISPLETGEVEIFFNTKNHKGKQSKRVTITANTEPAQTFVTIKGTVINENYKKPKHVEREVVIPHFPKKVEKAKASKETSITQHDRPKIENKTVNKYPKPKSKTDCYAIYPNPTSETLQLEISDFLGKAARVEIHSESGQKMITKNIKHISKSTTKFDVSSFPAGIYYITIYLPASEPMTQCFVVVQK